MTMIAETSQVHVRHLRGRYLVPKEYPAPDDVRRRLDEALQRELPAVLTAALTPLVSDSDTSVWLIRHLDLAVDVNAAWNRNQLARAVAPQIAGRLAEVLRDGGDGENAIRFPSRAAYLARFLVDTAAGRAAGRWYYEPFVGLRMLPVSATLRTAVCDDTQTGLAALQTLTAEELDTVLLSLTAPDAAEILRVCAAAGGSGDVATCLDRVWHALQSRAAPRDGLGEAQTTLCLFIQATRNGGGSAALRDAALALARLIRLVSDGEANVADLLAASMHGDAQSLGASYGAETSDILRPLLACPRPWLSEVEGVPRLGSKADNGQTSAGAGVRYTPFGAAFLLLPLLDELPVAAATESCPDPDDWAAAQAVRCLLLFKCCGGERAARLFADPVIRDVMRVPAALSPSALLAWQLRLNPLRLDALERILGGDVHDAPGSDSSAPHDSENTGETPLHPTDADGGYLALPSALCASSQLDRALDPAARHVLSAFARRLPGFAASTPRYLWRNFLDVRASVEDEPGRCVVRLTRPPLHLILAMTGMVRCTYRVSWLDEVALEIYPEN